MAGNAHVMGPQRSTRRNTFDLRDYQTTMIAHGDGLFQTTKIGALMLIRQVSVLIRCRGPQNGDIRHNIRKVQPGFTSKFLPVNNRLGSGRVVHRAALAFGINKGLQPDLGQYTRPPCGHITVHVKQNARWNIIRFNPVLDDHLPDLGHLQ